MKKLVLQAALWFALLAVTNVYAQEVQLATLQHGENMQVFYGADALKNAMTAADHGDKINLTAGTFNATTITKAVILQGAGYFTDTAVGRYRTAILGDFDIQLPKTAEGLVIEKGYLLIMR